MPNPSLTEGDNNEKENQNKKRPTESSVSHHPEKKVKALCRIRRRIAFWRWCGDRGDAGSLNHYSPGTVCQWLFDTVAGIRQDGENRFRIVPVPGGTLTEAKASYLSPYGKVASEWKKTDGGYQLWIEIPANCTAEITLPDQRTETVTAGTYRFTVF